MDHMHQNICPLNISEPSDLKFQKSFENTKEHDKRKRIEKFLDEGNGIIEITKLQELASSEFGLVNDQLRRKLWPQLVGVDVNRLEPVPSLSDLQSHPEYNQVVLDVNRSLKRFPPGIPYEQRIALQDQLTILILRVIRKYPNLRYYQGYHDVAVTFLLVVGEDLAYAVMEQLSINHFAECMEETMDSTQKRLMYMWPIVNFENPELYEFLQASSVGTLFSLPWYLTWFGHSLNSYKDVVRLYDYFLASPIYSAIFVTAAILLYRASDILLEDCDMASIHCFLSKLPDDLPFEQLLKDATRLYRKYSLVDIGIEVEAIIAKERQKRLLDEEQNKIRRYNKKPNNNKLLNFWLSQLLRKKSMIVTTAFSIIVGFCAYYYRRQYLPAGVS